MNTTTTAEFQALKHERGDVYDLRKMADRVTKPARLEDILNDDTAAAHLYPCDLERFKDGEHYASAFSLKVGSPTHGTSVGVFTIEQVRDAMARLAGTPAAAVPTAGKAVRAIITLEDREDDQVAVTLSFEPSLRDSSAAHSMAARALQTIADQDTPPPLRAMLDARG